MVQRLAASIADCETGNSSGLAARGWRRTGGGDPLIKQEVAARRSRRASSSDRTHGCRQSPLGQKRIQAELARLGFQVSARTVAKYMRGCRRWRPTGTWREFLTRHASNMWACDFFCVPTVLFQTLHVFFVIRLRRRLCSFRTGAISLYLLRAARSCAARIMLQRYVE